MCKLIFLKSHCQSGQKWALNLGCVVQGSFFFFHVNKFIEI